MNELKIYNEYKKYGVNEYYKKYASCYFNPHEEKIKNNFKKILEDVNLISNSNSYSHLISKNKKLDINKKFDILDIACGDGLVFKILNYYLNEYNEYKNIKVNIEGTDPYFNNKYCNYNYSFEDIANGKMLNKKYDIGICCYAFHLLDKSWYFQFFNELCKFVNKFIIITPSKKIKINHDLWVEEQNYRTNDKITIIILKNLYSNI